MVGHVRGESDKMFLLCVRLSVRVWGLVWGLLRFICLFEYKYGTKFVTASCFVVWCFCCVFVSEYLCACLWWSSHMRTSLCGEHMAPRLLCVVFLLCSCECACARYYLFCFTLASHTRTAPHWYSGCEWHIHRAYCMGFLLCSCECACTYHYLFCFTLASHTRTSPSSGAAVHTVAVDGTYTAHVTAVLNALFASMALSASNRYMQSAC